MNKNSKIGRTLIGVVAMAVLVACGGGSDGDGASDGGSSSDGDSDATIVTVVDIPGVSDSCESMINMISATGQVIAGQLSSDAAKSTIADFVAAVPDEIRAEAEIMADAYLAYVEILGAYSGDFAAAGADPEAIAALEALNSADTNAAYEKVALYLQEECAWLG
jgi:hypothetical protein